MIEIILFFVVVFLFLKFRKKKSKIFKKITTYKNTPKEPDIYVPPVKRRYFFTRNERLLYDTLYQIINDNKAYDLFSKVRWEDIWTATYREDRGYIRSRHVDFVIFCRKTGEVKIVIELNGEEHYTNQKQIERDERLKRMCINTNTTLLIIKKRGMYDCGEIKKELNKCLADKNMVREY